MKVSHHMETPLHQCATEGVSERTRGVRYWWNETFTPAVNRPELRVYSDRLECGSWLIRYADVQRAVLHTRYSLFSPPMCVLTIAVSGKTYRFDCLLSRFWEGNLPFPVERSGGGSARFKLTALVTRYTLIAGMLYLLWLIIRGRNG